MKALLSLTSILVVSLSLTGCKTPEEKLCPHLQKFVDDGKYSEGECAKDKEQVKKQCKNPDKVFECMLEKNSEKELGDCEKVCEKTEKK
ncbi:MAG: hypothetical protein HOW73_50550 [Polyangiaceae bacterium]|nr:hypothetical protein [Polyangiaceae bacterium]